MRSGDNIQGTTFPFRSTILLWFSEEEKKESINSVDIQFQFRNGGLEWKMKEMFLSFSTPTHHLYLGLGSKKN